MTWAEEMPVGLFTAGDVSEELEREMVGGRTENAFDYLAGRHLPKECLGHSLLC